MNPVLLLSHNNLVLTQRCVESVRQQDIPTFCYVLDNGSTDGTPDWLKSQTDTRWMLFDENMGVSFGWNDGLGRAFGTERMYLQHNESFPHCLVIGNDTVLPPWFYRELLSYDQPFVTGVAVDDMAMIAQPPDQRYPLTENPDFSAFLIRRDCWEKVGPFDERMKLYAGDCDFHVRAHRLGVPLYKACLPFYHERSSTLNNASPAEQQEIQMQANEDRRVFRELYGCVPGEPAYAELFK
jgi:GT2 family glycosyltransferase